MSGVWPAGVPHMPEMDGFGGAPFRAPLATEMDDGNQRQRRSTTKNVARLDLTIDMTEAQFVTLKGWVRDDLFDGTVPFTMPIRTGTDYESRTCTFAEPYRFAGAGWGRVRVSLTLDVDDY